MDCRLVSLLLLLMTAAPAWGDTDGNTTPMEASASPPKQWNTGSAVALAEGLTLLNSGLAAANPKIFGGAAILVAPLGCAEGDGSDHTSRAANWVMCGGFATLGAYDVTAYGEHYSSRQVFAQNFVAWNLMEGAALITAHYTGEDSAMTRATRHLSIVPQPHGGLSLDWHWTF